MTQAPAKRGSILVVGGGVAGMQSALDAAGAGFKVYLVERESALGGVASALDRAFPAGDCAMSMLGPRLADIANNPDIQVLTLAEVKSVEGEAGNFCVTIRRRPRLADVGECTAVDQGALVCEAKAVDHDDLERDETVDVGAIILASGAEVYDASRAGEYGCGRSRNVVTSIEYERILSASGPTCGRVERPSDGKPPKRVAFIQCVGSRSITDNANPWCSGVCCMYTARQAVVTRERAPDTDVTVFYIDIRAYGKGHEKYRDAAERIHGVRYVRSMPSSAKETKRTGDLTLRWVDEKDAVHDDEFDLVVLAVGLQAARGACEAAEVLGIDADEHGFPSVAETCPVETSRPGVFAAGAAVEPKDVPESVAAGSTAAAKVGEILADVRGSEIAKRIPPDERGAAGGEGGAGTQVGHSGDDAAGVGGVSAIGDEGLLEQSRRAGGAIEPRALVIGGGAAGMTAALSLAGQGFGVTFVEKEKSLGGNLKRLTRSVWGTDLGSYLSGIVKAVTSNPRIEVLTESRVTSTSGQAGNFESAVAGPDGTRIVRHGVTIVATGAAEYKPTEYLYGSDARVVTQREFEARLAEGRVSDAAHDGHAVVMIQCVGSRDEKRPYCSRVCCSQAVKNALEAKRLSPDTPVYVLYRDVRTYGFKEALYRRAREAGVLFIRYTPERRPEVTVGGDALGVKVFDNDLQEEVLLRAGTVVLSAGVVPDADAGEVSRLLELPVTEDGFFLEADETVRPVDFPSEGVYLCGLAHGPKLLDESVSQALAAAGRAATILARKGL